MTYTELSDEDKIYEAMKFVALGQPLPTVLETFLREAGLYDLILYPTQGATDVAENSLR